MELGAEKPKVVHVGRSLSRTFSSVQVGIMHDSHVRVGKPAAFSAQTNKIQPAQIHTNDPRMSLPMEKIEPAHQFGPQPEINRSSVQIQRVNRPDTFQQRTVVTPTGDRMVQGAQSISPIQFDEISMTSHAERSLISSASNSPVNGAKKERFGTWFDDVPKSLRRKDKANNERKRQRRAGGYMCTRCCCYCLMASILAAILLATLITAIVLIALRSKGETNQTTTTVTTATTTTATTATTTTSTASTSTTTTSTSSTSSTTSTTSTRTTSSSSTTSSTTTSTSSTTTTRTTTTSTTSTTTTSTTTTTAYDSCQHLRWNQTGVVVAGSSAGSAATQFDKPAFIYINANDTMYVCDHHNDRVQQWQRNGVAGVTVAGSAFGVIHPEGITFDKNGYMYVTGHQEHNVVRVSPGFTSATSVAGVFGSSGSALHLLTKPLGLAVDDDLNLYIAERDGERVVKWAPNATNGTIVINPAVSGTKFYGLLLSLYSSNQAYVSSEDKDAVYLWTFGLTAPTITLTAVNDTPSALANPRGIKYDSYGNLYVADKGNKRVVMYCNNATVGRVVVDTGTSPTLNTPLDVAFDSDMNMYVSDEGLQRVIRYDRL